MIIDNSSLDIHMIQDRLDMIELISGQSNENVVAVVDSCNNRPSQDVSLLRSLQSVGYS